VRTDYLRRSSCQSAGTDVQRHRREALDVHAPRSKVRCRVRRKTDHWYDSDCRAAKRRTRKLERRYKRWKSDHSRSVWLQSLRAMHRFVDQKHNEYWRSKTDSQASVRELWRSIDAILCRDSPNAAKPSRTANYFADFFESKVASIGTATDGASPPTFRDVMYGRNHCCTCSHLCAVTTSSNWYVVRQPCSPDRRTDRRTWHIASRE